VVLLLAGAGAAGLVIDVFAGLDCACTAFLQITALLTKLAEMAQSSRKIGLVDLFIIFSTMAAH
jgi:hypothetical protein